MKELIDDTNVLNVIKQFQINVNDSLSTIYTKEDVRAMLATLIRTLDDAPRITPVENTLDYDRIVDILNTAASNGFSFIDYDSVEFSIGYDNKLILEDANINIEDIAGLLTDV